MRGTLSRGTGAKTACLRLLWGKELSRSCEPRTRPLPGLQVYAGSEDAGLLREGRQVAAGYSASASVGEEVGCRVVPRLWSKAPGEIFSAADALCKHREAAEGSAAFREEGCGARSPPWGEQGLWDTCRLG